VVRVSQPRGRVTRLKLSRQLHLIPSQQLTAQRALPAKSRSAQRAVRSSRWQLRSADRFSRLLPEERLVGHDTSYVAGPRFAPRLAPYAMRPGEPDGRRPKPTRSGAAAPRHVTGGDGDLKSIASGARGDDIGAEPLGQREQTVRDLRRAFDDERRGTNTLLPKRMNRMSSTTGANARRRLSSAGRSSAGAEFNCRCRDRQFRTRCLVFRSWSIIGTVGRPLRRARP